MIGRTDSSINSRIAICLVVLFWSIAPPPSNAGSGPLNGKITFNTRRHIHVMNRDGSHVRRITDTKTYNREAKWSPNGRRIAYGCRGNRSSEKDICIAHPDGSHRRQLTDDEDFDSNPSWAPGGRRLVFSRIVGASYQLFVIDRADGGMKQITLHPTNVHDPEWSPNGDLILFHAIGPTGSDDIYTIRPDGTEQTNLTTSMEIEAGVSWSPDGSEIVFSRSGTLAIMDADGTNIRSLDVAGDNPDWSPNGKRIVAQRLRNNYRGCFSVTTDGSDFRWLSPRTKNCSAPDWAPRI